MLFNHAAAYDDAGFDDKAVAIFEQMIREFPEEKEEVLAYIREMNHGGGKANKYFAETISSTPTAFEMATAYPNPFNATTKISYVLPESGQISTIIFNTLGQKVRTLVDGVKGAGKHEILWDGFDDFGNAASSGLYLARFVTDSKTQTVKIALVH